MATDYLIVVFADDEDGEVLDVRVVPNTEEDLARAHRLGINAFKRIYRKVYGTPFKGSIDVSEFGFPPNKNYKPKPIGGFVVVT